MWNTYKYRHDSNCRTINITMLDKMHYIGKCNARNDDKCNFENEYREQKCPISVNFNKKIF